MGAYVPTDDMVSSELFYRVVFDRSPVIKLEDFVAFEVAGGWFALVSREKYAPVMVPGTGAVPYIQSGDLRELRARAVKAGLETPDIIDEPGIQILKLTDPNGLLIEFFKLMNE